MLFNGPKFDVNDNGDAVLTDPHSPQRSIRQGEGAPWLSNADLLRIDHPSSGQCIGATALRGLGTGKPFSIRDLPSPVPGGQDYRAAAARVRPRRTH
jgi:hypothetical protein